MGKVTDVCPAVNVVVVEPEKPPPETAKEACPTVALLRGIVIVPVCPVIALAVKVPVVEAVPQLKAKEDNKGETDTEGVHVPVPCEEVTVKVLAPAAPVPS
jgi:hypothetical protein